MLEIGLRRWSNELDNDGEHEIVGVRIELGTADDERFALFFQTASGRHLRVRLPRAELERLARCLFEAAAERV
jgi:hypothetical protein